MSAESAAPPLWWPATWRFSGPLHYLRPRAQAAGQDDEQPQPAMASTTKRWPVVAARGGLCRIGGPAVPHDQLPADRSRGAGEPLPGALGILCGALRQWRPGSWPGATAERTIRFLEPMSVSLISGSRQVAPFGLNGGASGACGENLRLIVRWPIPWPVPCSWSFSGRGHSHAHPRGGGMGR